MIVAENRKLRIVVEIKPNPDKSPGNFHVFEGAFESIANNVFVLLRSSFPIADCDRIGAVVSAGTVSNTAALYPDVEMQNLREYLPPEVPTTSENLSENALNLLRILGFGQVQKIDETVPEPTQSF